MATSNKTKKVSISQETEKENVNSAGLAEENAQLKVQLEEMMANYKEMQANMQNMQQLLIASQANQVSGAGNKDGSTRVGCRIFNGATLVSQGGDISIPIQYRDETEIDYSELREIFKNPFGYKTMFRKGTLYFVNDDDYKRFGITKDIDLSDNHLKSILENTNASAVIEEVKNITNDKRDLTEMFALIYQIAYLIDNKILELDYDVRNSLEKYFEVDFKTLINNLHQ